ncbi:ABC transporter ATP-binding protein [Allorhizobium sp. BGMRC 0089]|uniref:ABC transporter ATP-binding protein n=1 Tax=Allorhizobium sonneratiae TaxID=2934936 RepID=UPI0020349E6F|nr:ABC transporter ATP-binding protein [Allorhizobium sonneratiae]MCM2292642.1 ABC transporter ATP-binding protein [Allorhizobium sonneratiae]
MNVVLNPKAPLEAGAVNSAADPLLSVDGVTLQYKTGAAILTATYRVSFNVLKNDRFILLGPSGCGKSTLLKSVAGFLPPVEGKISLNGKTVQGPGPDRMMVFQEFDQLMPWMTVIDNVMFPMKRTSRFPGSDIRDRARKVIAKVGLSKFENSYPHMLSGGMKQRVAIARALAMEPQMLLMDEPFAALDALTRRRMQEELLELWDDVRFTLLFVTHSIEEAIIVGSRILVLSPHPGQVRAELDASAYGHSHQGDADFMAFNRKINQMLFGDQEVAHE